MSALEWLLTGVDSHVCVQTAGLCECFFTVFTRKRLIAHVRFHVLHQFARLFECFATNRTLVQMGIGVRELMFGEQSGRFEALITILAWKWINLCMRFLMQNEAARIHKPFFANVALMRFSCRMRT